MGAAEFIHEQSGTAVEAAFYEALEETRYDPISISKKDDHTIIQTEPLPEAAAIALARQLLADLDPRFSHKWGPAGAIPVRGGRRVHKVTVPAIPGGYPNIRAAETAAVKHLQLTDGEQVIYGITGCYKDDRWGRILSGTATVPTHGAAAHTSWLFFGRVDY